MTTTESLLPEFINDFCNKIGTKRRIDAVQQLDRYSEQSGHAQPYRASRLRRF
jgi:hypothetical protein